MITLDTNIYLTKHYLLNTKRANANAYKSIDEYTQAQAASQSTSVVNETKTEPKTLKQIIQSLKLESPSQRFFILKSMKSSDLVYLLQFMDKKDLIMGLKFFNKKKLLKFINALPKKDMANMLFKMLSPKEIMQLMPVSAFQEVLRSKKTEKRFIMNAAATFEPYLLSRILEGATGMPAGNKSKVELLNSIGSLSKEKISEGIATLPPKNQVDFMTRLITENKQLFLEFKQESMMAPMMQLEKPQLMKGMTVLEPEQVINMLSELPEELLSQVAVLLEPGKLSEILEGKFSGLLSKMAV